MGLASRTRRAWGWAGTPRGASVLALLLLADAALMVGVFRHDARLGNAVLRTLGVYEPARSTVFEATVVWWNQGPPEVIPFEESAERITRALQSDPARLLRVVLFEGEHVQGGIAPWSRRRFKRVEVESLWIDSPVTPGEAAAARTDVSRWLDRAGAPRDAAAVASPDFDRTSTLWWGVAHDALVVLILLRLLIATPHLLDAAVHARPRRLRRKGLCPACRYDLRGTKPDLGVLRCPECGSVWPAQADP